MMMEEEKTNEDGVPAIYDPSSAEADTNVDYSGMSSPLEKVTIDMDNGDEERRLFTGHSHDSSTTGRGNNKKARQKSPASALSNAFKAKVTTPLSNLFKSKSSQGGKENNLQPPNKNWSTDEYQNKFTVEEESNLEGLGDAAPEPEIDELHNKVVKEVVVVVGMEIQYTNLTDRNLNFIIVEPPPA